MSSCGAWSDMSSSRTLVLNPRMISLLLQPIYRAFMVLWTQDFWWIELDWVGMLKFFSIPFGLVLFHHSLLFKWPKTKGEKHEERQIQPLQLGFIFSWSRFCDHFRKLAIHFVAPVQTLLPSPITEQVSVTHKILKWTWRGFLPVMKYDSLHL